MLCLFLGSIVSFVVFCWRGFLMVGLYCGSVVWYMCFIKSLVLLGLLVVLWLVAVIIGVRTWVRRVRGVLRALVICRV